MNQRPSKSVVERVVDWLRGFFTPPDANRRKSTEREAQPASTRSAQEPSGADRAAGDITEPLHDTAQGRAGQTATTSDEGRQELPDLDASDSAHEYSRSGAAARSADTGDEDNGTERSDLDDAAGNYDVDNANYPSDTSDADDVYNLHDAVGGHSDEADDDTDGVIDTNRDTDFPSGSSDRDRAVNVPEVDDDIPNVSQQDELTAFDGASSDEFAAGGYTPKPLDQDAVKAAAESDPTMVPDEDSPENVDHQHDVAAGSAGTGGSTVSNQDELAGPAGGQRASSGSGGVTREDIESSAAGDAFVQGDEAVTAPGQSDASAFTDVETGTTEPSRSATGNELDDEQDALGTTLEHTDDEESPFDADQANLSAQEELIVDDENAGAAGDERVTSFQSGTIARETLASGAETSAGVDEHTDSYADFPDEPEPEDTDDSGLDDFSGDDYPSDRRVDRVDGDDAFDAITPDADETGSSAGDLDTPENGEELLINQIDQSDDVSGDLGPMDRTIDQDDIATSDEHVGGEEPGFVDNMRDVDTAPEGGAGGAVATGGAGAAGDSDIPAGAVRGDGTTDTPEGYPVKGNASSMIYHLPDFPSYKGTKAEFCFATEDDAIAAGFRAPGRRNRGRNT